MSPSLMHILLRVSSKVINIVPVTVPFSSERDIPDLYTVVSGSHRFEFQKFLKIKVQKNKILVYRAVFDRKHRYGAVFDDTERY